MNSDTCDVTSCEVAIVGGGPAGLAAATALARSLRSVVVVDAGEPRNDPPRARTTSSVTKASRRATSSPPGAPNSPLTVASCAPIGCAP